MLTSCARLHAAEAANAKTELERMENVVEDVKGKKGLIAARAGQARSGGGAEGLGARSGANAFDEFRRMEDRIEGAETEAAAAREASRGVHREPGPTGLGPAELEAKFRALEPGALSRHLRTLKAGGLIEEAIQSMTRGSGSMR